MKKKMSKKQNEKLELMKEFLKTDIGFHGMLIGDNDASFIYNLKKIYSNATGIYMTGSESCGKAYKDRIDFNQISKLFSAGKRADEDFALFLENKNFK